MSQSQTSQTDPKPVSSSIGDTLANYKARLLRFIETQVVDNVPQSVIVKAAPQYGIDHCFDAADSNAKILFPGFHTEFPVEGVRKGHVQWFVEAPNRTKDDPVIIYLHGGGFEIGLFPFFVEFTRYLYTEVGNTRLSILFLDYTLSVDAKHPQQISELSRVFDKVSESSSNIWLMGDSAGGALSLMTARHIYDPYPGAQVVSSKVAIHGMILLSPWVNMDPIEKEGTSYVTNKGEDILTAYALRGMGKMYLEDLEKRATDRFTMYKTDWNKYLPKDKKKVFVSLAKNEVLFDDIKLFVNVSGLQSADVFEDPISHHDEGVFHPKTIATAAKVVEFLKREL